MKTKQKSTKEFKLINILTWVTINETFPLPSWCTVNLYKKYI